MPWKELTKMSERMKFVLRLDEGDSMSDLCREFCISRKTGYKIYNRFQEEGIVGLEDKRRNPLRNGNQTPNKIKQLILETKELKKTWGARKLREYLLKRHSDLQIPATSTIHTILHKEGHVKNSRKRRHKAVGTNLRAAKDSNDLWCTDFKGQFRLGNKQYCYPLTITDQSSRFLIACDSLDSTKGNKDLFLSFQNSFKKYGMPYAIRTDNGAPFSSRTIFGLSNLSIWWLRLGISLERIAPGHPEQNGRHERMHRTLKAATTKPPGKNILHQQEIFDDFVKEFNTERPHEALSMKCPSDIYTKSDRTFPKALPDLEYPDDYNVKTVASDGVIHVGGCKRVFISSAFKYQELGVKEVDDEICEVKFMDYTLGFFDQEKYKLTIVDHNPFDYNI